MNSYNFGGINAAIKLAITKYYIYIFVQTRFQEILNYRTCQSSKIKI